MKTLEKFRTWFESEKTRILEVAKQAREDFYVPAEESMDEFDSGSWESQSQMVARLRSRDAIYLKKLDQAIHRIVDGSYGLCQCCEEPIEMRRLEARPTTDLCVACKEEEEHRESLHIDGHRSKSLGMRLKLAFV